HNKTMSELYKQNTVLPLELENRSTVPDIIDPTLPESILIELAFFYPSPFPSAPDFQRVFTHRVNIPGAYRRKSESLLTKNFRRVE
ncbi:MAG: hypothetical protein VCD00_12325, partial [Candidatus Hydrogenedentota bacterium]